MIDWVSRFWRFVEKGPDCWLWTGSTLTTGYGQLRVNGKTMASHRLSWIIHHGSIPPGTGVHGTCVLHKCDNRLCVRPDHLFIGSQRDNVADMISKGRRAPTAGYGENARSSKLTMQDVEAIRSIYAAGGVTHRQIAAQFSVERSTITAILSGKNWSRNNG